MLKVLVGSRSHGLEKEDSDYDYRGIFIQPTSEILQMNAKKRAVNWTEGNIDNVEYEIGHFLELCIKCNPSVLEVLCSNIVEVEPGYEDIVSELVSLLPDMLTSSMIRDAFIGYGRAQQKKMLEDKDGKWNKFAAAYLRTLYHGRELLLTKTLTVRIADTSIGDFVRAVKYNDNSKFDISIGNIINMCIELENALLDAYELNKEMTADIEKINTFLLKIRKTNW